jgi:hypothetical protein
VKVFQELHSVTSGAKALKAAASSARLKSGPDTKHFPLGLKPSRLKAGLDVRANARCCEVARTLQAVAFEVQADARTLQAVAFEVQADARTLQACGLRLNGYSWINFKAC